MPLANVKKIYVSRFLPPPAAALWDVFAAANLYLPCVDICAGRCIMMVSIQFFCILHPTGPARGALRAGNARGGGLLKRLFYGRAGKWMRRLLLFLLDMLFVFFSLELAIGMRYEGGVSASMHARLIGLLPEIVAVYAAVSIVGGVYDMIWRYAGAAEVMRLALVYALSAGATLLLNRVVPWYVSRPVLVMTGMCMMLLVSSTRFAYKLLREFVRARRSGESADRILIVGAGEGGVYAARICQQNREKFGQPVAFADDDPLKRKMRIAGIPVCGTIDEVPEIVRSKEIDEIVVAVPGTKGERLAEIVSICKGTRCRTRILSDPGEADRPSAAAFRELNTSDFLSRDEVALDMEMIRGYLRGKVVMVTGGGGSIGSEISRQIMRFEPKQLILFDVYENGVYELECELKHKYGGDCPVTVLIGSIRDRRRLDDVFEAYRPQVVFHAAAHKHVPLMEVCPAEAVKNNVFGTRNLLQSADEHGVERFVQLSTDKAVNPTNVMGATKRITEMLLQCCARRSKMRCMAVRFGNVLGSHGSVIPLFESQIRHGGPVTLTHPDITRFFMTIPEAAQLVLQAGGLAQSGAIYVLDMGEPVRLMDLAEKLIRFYGYEPGVDIEIKIIGLRPGEKLYEELMMDSERDFMTRTAHNKIFVAPPIPIEEAAFDRQLAALREAAVEDDDARVVELLTEIVSTYKPNRGMLAS